MDNNPYNLFLNIKTLIKFHESDPISGVHNLIGCGRAHGTNYFVYTNQTNLLNNTGCGRNNVSKGHCSVRRGSMVVGNGALGVTSHFQSPS